MVLKLEWKITESAPEVCPSCDEKFVSKLSQMPSNLNLSDEFKFKCANCLEDYRDFEQNAENRRQKKEEEEKFFTVGSFAMHAENHILILIKE